MKFSRNSRYGAQAMLALSSIAIAAAAYAGKVGDGHGNEAYDTAAECDAAVSAGTAKFYQSFTEMPPLKRAGEVDVKVMKLGELPGFSRGACDQGSGRRGNRDGVAGALIGKWVPFSPDLAVNV